MDLPLDQIIPELGEGPYGSRSSVELCHLVLGTDGPEAIILREERGPFELKWGCIIGKTFLHALIEFDRSFVCAFLYITCTIRYKLPRSTTVDLGNVTLSVPL